MLLVAFAIPSSPFRQPVTATTLQQQRRQLEEQQHLEISREHYLTASCDIPYNISISIWAVDSVDFVDSVSAFEGESNKYTNSRACQGRVNGQSQTYSVPAASNFGRIAPFYALCIHVWQVSSKREMLLKSSFFCWNEMKWWELCLEAPAAPAAARSHC